MSLALTAVLSGCYFLNPYAGLYAPGGELADKHEGPLLLADITDESINTALPTSSPAMNVKLWTCKASRLNTTQLER